MQDLPFIIDWTEICVAVLADGCCFDDFLFAIRAFFYFYLFRFHFFPSFLKWSRFCLPAMGDGCPGHCHIKSVFTPDWCDHPADVCDTKTSLYRSQVFDRNIVLLAVSGGVNISRLWFFVKIHFSNSPSRPCPHCHLQSKYMNRSSRSRISWILFKTNNLKQTLARINILLQIFVYLCLIIDEYLLFSEKIRQTDLFNFTNFLYFLTILCNLLSFFLQFRIDIESCRNIISNCNPP